MQSEVWSTAASLHLPEYLFHMPFRTRTFAVKGLLFPALVLMALFSGDVSARDSVQPLRTIEPVDSPAVRDVHSYARPDEAWITHVDIGLSADFEERVLSGSVTLSYETAPDARELVLDTRELSVRAVETPSGDPLQWTLGPVDEILGQPLTVVLPDRGDRIVIRYHTVPEADAVQWLDPEQTAGGEHPFLFTQGQSILTRTWIPTQDSPGIRQTYEATITVPEELTAVMSAEMLPPEGVVAGDSMHYRFRMEHPIPPYLIAQAIGDLEFRALGPQTGVWAEPEVVERAAYEFADMPEMLTTAEELYGPYRWERFDVLVLPPSFPYGGMENPRLTFATPTLLAGDRSLVSTIAHELAHSWSGNLVTNATWDDFWLNEGFTTYIEYRIMEEIYGAPYTTMIEQLGRQTLHRELEEVDVDEKDTALKIDLANRHPDAGPTYVPYEKGAAFLRTIEKAAGRARFDAFLRRYFDEHAFQPMTTERFLAYMDRELIQGDTSLRDEIQPEAWIYGPGLPENAVPLMAEAFVTVETQADAFQQGVAAEELKTDEWSTHEWLHFLQALPEKLPETRMHELDEAFALTESNNSEILFAWLLRSIRSRYEPALPALAEFLTGQGRAKFVVPLYRALVETEWGDDLAEEIFHEARRSYHSVTAQAVERVLRGSS